MKEWRNNVKKAHLPVLPQRFTDFLWLYSSFQISLFLVVHCRRNVLTNWSVYKKFYPYLFTTCNKLHVKNNILGFLNMRRYWSLSNPREKELKQQNRIFHPSQLGLSHIKVEGAWRDLDTWQSLWFVYNHHVVNSPKYVTVNRIFEIEHGLRLCILYMTDQLYNSIKSVKV